MKKAVLIALLALIGQRGRAQDMPADSADGDAARIHIRSASLNLLAIAPIQFTENGLLGVGISYERALSPGGVVALYLPAILEFNTLVESNYGGLSRNTFDPLFYLMPGIKLYPSGNDGLLKYAIGPSLVIADGRKTIHDYTPTLGYFNYRPQNYFLLGAMANQSVNISPTPRLYLGVEAGVGFTYYDRIGTVEQVTATLFQFSFKIGYRF